MSPAHLASIAQAECVKLSTRLSARLGLLLSAAIGVALPFLLWLMNSEEAVVNGTTLADSLQASAPKAALWALYARNLWVMQAVVLLICAQSLAGELQARTLREDLLRPVSRAGVLFAKYVAVAVFITLTLALQFVVASAVGAVLVGVEGPWKEVAVGYLATGAADLSFAAVAFAIASLVRRVSGTLVITLLFIVFEKLLAWALFVVGGILQSLPPEMNQLPEAVFILIDLQPGLPSTAWGVGSTMGAGQPVEWVSWGALVAYLVVGAAVAWIRTARMEVP